MRATVKPSENNYVTLTVEVDEGELSAAIDKTAATMASQINIKGFRKGKAPRKLIETHIGGPAVLRSEAIRESMPDFYALAISDTLVDPISQPTLSIISGEDAGVVIFEAEVEVRPEVEINGHGDLRVTIPSPIVSDDEVDKQIQRILETDAELNDVDRPIVTGDVVVIDVNTEVIAGQEGKPLNVEDFSYTVGAGNLADGVDETILGLKAGETLDAMGRMPDGTFQTFHINIKQVKERILPDLTDEWAEENTEYETADALRDGIVNQLRRMKLVEAQMARRDNVLVALSELVDAEAAPFQLVDQEVQSRLQDLVQRLEQQGIGVEYFLEMTGQTPDQLLEQLREDALRAVRVDLALRAVAAAEDLAPSEDEIAEELEATATALKIKAEVLKENLDHNGRTPAFTAEVAKMKASKWLLEHVTYVDDAGSVIDTALLETDQSVDDSAYGEDDE